MGARTFASSLFTRDTEVCKRRNSESQNMDYDMLAKAMATGWLSGL